MRALLDAIARQLHLSAAPAAAAAAKPTPAAPVAADAQSAADRFQALLGNAAPTGPAPVLPGQEID